MSLETVNQFLQKVSEDPQLQQDFAQALSSENQQQATYEVASKYGYDCSSDELWGEIKNIQSEFQTKIDAGEIDEEELMAVAGGAGGTMRSGLFVAGATLAAALINKFWD